MSQSAVERGSALECEFMVQSLIFAFDILEVWGFKPYKDDEFMMGVESDGSRAIDALIRLDKYPMEIYRKHAWVVKRDIGRHRQCIRGEGGDESGKQERQE